jgi:phospholipase C
MGYYDGNTVAAMWNYAQRFALNDNTWATTFGPSTPGALNLISGQTNGFDAFVNVVDGSGNLLHATHEAKDGNGNFTEIGDGELSMTCAPTRASTRSRCTAPISVTCSTPRRSPGARSWAGST